MSTRADALSATPAASPNAAERTSDAMILSDRDIKRYLKEGRLVITPPPDFSEQLGACSMDLRLGNDFNVFDHSRLPFIDLKGDYDIESFMKKITVPDTEHFVLQPGEFVLASTRERLEIPDDLVGHIDGRSSLGRLGLIIHGTASTFAPGFRGTAVLELSNIGRMPIALYPGMRVCSFAFSMLSSPAEVPYYKNPKAKYSNQDGPEASRATSDKIICGQGQDAVCELVKGQADQ